MVSVESRSSGSSMDDLNRASSSAPALISPPKVLTWLISGFQTPPVAHAVAVVVGQFYVMMNPEVLQTASPRTIAPRTHTYTA